MSGRRLNRVGHETLKPVMTLEEIAERMNMTRERVRQIEQSALMNMRKKLRALGYKPSDFFSDLSEHTEESKGVHIAKRGLKHD